MSTANGFLGRYAARGWQTVPVHRPDPATGGCSCGRPTCPKPGKHPDHRFWPGGTDDPAHFAGRNVGVQLGPVSWNLADVDFDCAEATRIGSFLLPATNGTFGRGGQATHALYTVADAAAAFAKLADLTGDRATIVELRWPEWDEDTQRYKVLQTVFPPSLHVCGETLAWMRDGEPGAVAGADLVAAVRHVGAAVLIARYARPPERRQLVLLIANLLVRTGWEDDPILRFMAAVFTARNDPEKVAKIAGGEGSGAVADARKRLTAGKPMKGLPALKEMLDPALDAATAEKVVARVTEWLGVSDPAGPGVTSGGGRASAGGGTTDGWEAPEPLPEMSAVPAFPVELFPPPVRDYWLAAARSLHVPVDYVADPTLALLGAACGRAVAAEVKRTYQESPLLWCVVVAAPGRAKSPALGFAMGPLMAVARRWLEAYQEELQAYRAEKVRWEVGMKEWKTGGCDGEPPAEPEQPSLRQLVFINFTVEAFIRGNAANPRGVVLAKDELSGLVAALNQYKGGKGDDRQNLLSMWAGAAVVLNREKDRQAGVPPLTFAHSFGAVAGMIQPDLLPTFRGDLGQKSFVHDGWADRFLLSYPDPLPLVGETWETVSEELERGYAAVYESLLAREMVAVETNGGAVGVRPYYVPFDGTAVREWERFTGEVAAWANALDPEDPYVGVLSKFRHHGLRLVALVHALRLACGEVEELSSVTGETVRRAVALVWYFVAHGERALGVGWADRRSRVARRLVAWLVRHPDRTAFRRSDAYLTLKDRRDVRSSEALDPSFRLLIDHNYIRPATMTQSVRSGPTPEVYVVNPGWDRNGGEHVPGVPKVDPPSDGRPSNIRDSRVEASGDADEDADEAPADSVHAHDAHVPGIPKVDPPSDGRETDDDGGSRVEPPPGPTRDPNPATGARPGRGYSSASAVRSDLPETHSDPVGPPVGGEFGNVAQNEYVYTRPRLDAYPLITSPAGVVAVVGAIEDDGGPVGADTETTGLDSLADRVRLLQVATGRGTFLIDLFALPDPTIALADLFAVLTQVEVVGHNLQFDLRFLARLGFTPGRVFDTQLASQVLHAGERAENNAPLRHKLKDVVARELGRQMDKAEQKSDWSRLLTPEQLAYAVADAVVLVPLAETLKQKLADADLTATARLEMRALPGVAWAAPVRVDAAAWAAVADAAAAEQTRLAGEMDALAPNGATLFGSRNWNSPDQVRAAFAGLGVTLDSTDDGALAVLDHPLAGLLRDYRAAAKRAGTYGRAWLARHVRPAGRVVPSWHQLGAEYSGRMSCSDPNLQNVPRGADYRRCFVAGPGNVLVKADYSQIELRIAAKITGDRRMLDAYRTGQDLHALTAAALLGKPAAEVTRADRQLAKAVNFGLLYGQSAGGLRAYARANYGVSLTADEAARHRETFFRTYPGLRLWHRSVGDAPIDTRTLGGRRRVGVARFSEKLNTPVQGTGADGLKAAIALLWERRAECPAAVPVLFVHDEVVLEVPEADADAASAWLRRCMADAVTPLVDPVPVEVEVTAGRTWGG